MQKYECCNCGDIFDEKSRICEDWQIVQKSLICPCCKYYLQDATDYNRSRKVGSAFLIVCLLVGLVYMLAVYVYESKVAEISAMVVFVFVVLPLGAWYRLLCMFAIKPIIKTNALGKSNM